MSLTPNATNEPQPESYLESNENLKRIRIQIRPQDNEETKPAVKSESIDPGLALEPNEKRKILLIIY